MARTFTAVLVLLAALQIAHQASITKGDAQDFNERLNKLFTFNPGSGGVSNSHDHNGVEDNQGLSSEEKHIDNFQINHSFLRSKRQIEQGTSSNDDLSADESETISPEKSEEMTTKDDDLSDESHSDQEDKHLWDEDSDENDKNQLMEAENEKEKEEHEASVVKDDTEGEQPEKPDSSLTVAQTSVMSDKENKNSDSLLEVDDKQADRFIVGSKTDVKVKNGVNVTDSDEDDLSDDISINHEATPTVQENDNDMFVGNGHVQKTIQADNPKDLEDDKEDSDSSNNSKETIDHGETNVHDNKLSVENDGGDTFSDVDGVDGVDDIHDGNIDEDDVDTFLPLNPSTAHSPLAHLKQLDDDSEYPEGSGDDSKETNENDEKSKENNTDPKEFRNSSSDIDDGSINIDDDPDDDGGDADDDEGGEADSETGGANSISDKDGTEMYDTAKESASVLIETSTTSVDPSVTYDPLKVKDPLGIDNITNVMEFGFDKVFGTIDIDGSGSGDDDRADSLETDGVFKVSTEREESTTRVNIDEPLMNKTRLHQEITGQIKQGTENDSPVLIPSQKELPSEVNNPINEMGINKGEKEPVSSTDEETNSSTGSFIVLGAIMATIVVLLGYSVIKSRRQKRQAPRRPLPYDNGTELKEIDSLLPGKNGHGPGGTVNVEGEKLLSPKTDDEKNVFKGDDRPVYTNGFHPDNGIAGVHTPNPLNVDLSEIKVEDPQKSQQKTFNNTHDLNPDDVTTVKPAITPNNSSVPVTNGYSPTDPLGNNTHEDKPDEKDSPKADDRGSWVYGNQPETAKTKMFIDHDSIPKTPVLIVKRGSSDVDM